MNATFIRHYFAAGDIKTRTVVLTVDLPALTGSEKQISYGERKRREAIEGALHVLTDSPARAADFDSDPKRRERVLSALAAEVARRTAAKTWIEGSSIELVRAAIRAAV